MMEISQTFAAFSEYMYFTKYVLTNIFAVDSVGCNISIMLKLFTHVLAQKSEGPLSYIFKKYFFKKDLARELKFYA